MSTLAKRVPHDGNPLYPLPADYFSLTTEDAKRLARINACRQWTLWRENPFMRGFSYVNCIRFFDTYYLTRELDDDGETVFDPYFYTEKLPPPAWHDAARAAMRVHRKSMFVGPRGGAKTVALFMVPTLLEMLSHPVWVRTYATSTQELSEEFGDRTKYQLYENPRIFDDWAPEYYGRIKPNRSEGKQGMSAFKLSNRSSLFCTSAQSRQRGMRPHVYGLDDPEYDPKVASSTEELRDGLEYLIFRVALKMVSQPGTSLVWGGTFVSLAHLLWHANETEEVLVNDKLVVRSKEKRWGTWYRMIQPAATEQPVKQPDGSIKMELVSCWPEMWPATIKQKEEMGLPTDTISLEEMREDGEDEFQAEMMANPAGVRSSHFEILSQPKHGYWYEQPDDLLTICPPRSSAILCWQDGDKIIKMPLREYCARFRRAVSVDTSYSEKKSSDYKAAMCLSLNADNDLFAFDLWGAQASQGALVTNAFKMADRWLAGTIHPEAIKAGLSVTNDMIDIVRTRAKDVVGVTHLARIMPFNPGITEKGDRIAGALTWRFTHGKVKLPFFLKDQFPWSLLFAQIRGFKPQANNCGLQHDDFLDVLHMSRNIFLGLPIYEEPKRKEEDDRQVSVLLERWRAGERTDKAGLPLFYSIQHRLTPEDLEKILIQEPVRGGAI